MSVAFRPLATVMGLLLMATVIATCDSPLEVEKEEPTRLSPTSPSAGYSCHWVDNPEPDDPVIVASGDGGWECHWEPDSPEGTDDPDSGGNTSEPLCPDPDETEWCRLANGGEKSLALDIVERDRDPNATDPTCDKLHAVFLDVVRGDRFSIFETTYQPGLEGMSLISTGKISINNIEWSPNHGNHLAWTAFHEAGHLFFGCGLECEDYLNDWANYCIAGPDYVNSPHSTPVEPQ